MKTEKVILDGKEYNNVSFMIGLGLAISSSVFIGSSFIIKKIALKRIDSSGSLRASAGGFSYLKQWMWWLGLITMGIGEAANLLAYAFAPAALVTPLGALSVLVAAIGCFLCIIGSIIFVIHSPKSEEIKSFSELVVMLSDFMFLSYVGSIVIMSFILKIVFVPRFGNSNIAIYLLLCSAIGSLTVVFCKAVAMGVKETISGHVNNFSNYVFWLLFGASLMCIMIQMNYLNKSLDIFNTSVVTPVYYVMFTVLVIIASGILFKEWNSMPFEDILGCFCGFLVVITAVFMLNAFRDIEISIKDLNFNRRNRSTQNIEAQETYRLSRTR
ncbi:Non-imprinted in Prader-Willi/Angelman syndrome region protein 2-like protein [Operophtera brumata]|uniref:Non-imprinted in Prader-Willi/Angelman syndrome region protein 2-like protein n=1 Tax=Operophtera brumata TaxID=104452 RepID=A0A0L7KRJ4_OPEBR|nr:Non-imprinted in Prader-Willi/Angelman syndrome region protein 2-like protein [Operophtera brumata]